MSSSDPTPSAAVRAEPVPHRIWGEGLEPEAIQQLVNACRLPISVAGALMPDAHIGYGLPIGGVLACAGAVIPYAVGVDIACRMKLSVFDLPPGLITGQKDRLAKTLESETRFGVGVRWNPPRDHAVLDEDWTVSPVTARLKDKAHAQLGTSGSGNHFVELGVFTVPADIPDDGATGGALPAGEYLALLSHSGSRGTGAQICDHYSRLAIERMRGVLPKEFLRLAWLGLDTAEGQEYWAAMELMGQYASANHALIHRAVIRKLGAEVLFGVENHHNFAWKETHVIDGAAREVVVHRKGATPAAAGVRGVIPGSMTAPGFVVRGRGDAASLNSAAHGAGRVMSRSKAAQSFTWGGVRPQLRDAGVTLLSAGIDEVPGVYKDIHAVMRAQRDLVEVLGEFQPRIVKMCPAGEKAED